MDTELVANISNIIVASSAAIVAGLAIYGISRWQRELKGKAKFEVARNVMTIAYRVQEDFTVLRAGGSWPWESSDRQREEDETPGVTQVLDEWHVRVKRLLPLQADLAKLVQAGWEVKIVMGDITDCQVAGAIDSLRSRYGEIYASIDLYFRMEYERAKGTGISQDSELPKDCFTHIYYRKDDDISKGIDKAINELSSALRSFVK